MNVLLCYEWKYTIILILVSLSIESSAQNFQWVKTAGSPSFGEEEVSSIATDPFGNIYVIGNFRGLTDFDPGLGTANLNTTGGVDIFVASYTATGVYRWAFSLGTSNFFDRGEGIAVDASGNVYITGGLAVGTCDFDPGSGVANLSNTSASFGARNFFLAKYNTLGEYQWAFLIGGNDGSERGLDLTIDASNNLYVIGDFQLTKDFDPGAGVANLTSSGSDDVFVASYTTNASFRWAFSLPSSAVVDDNGRSITLDANANVHITGSFGDVVDFDPSASTFNVGLPSSNNIFVAKYSSLGNLIWAFAISGNSSDDTGEGIAVDPAGNVYVTGDFIGTKDFDPGLANANLSAQGLWEDIFVASYDLNGDYRWAFNMGNTQSDAAQAISVDGFGDVFITGRYQMTVDFDPSPSVKNLTSLGGPDIFVASYTSQGAYNWAFGIGGNAINSNSDAGLDISFNGCELLVGGRYQNTADFDPGTGTSNFSSNASTQDLFIASFSCSVLPSILSSFYGEAGNLYNELFWSTTNETNRNVYIVEHSSDGDYWNEIGKLTGGASSEYITYYRIKDYQQYIPITYYRLKQIDAYGYEIFSKTIKLNSKKERTGEIGLLFPNPANQSVSIRSCFSELDSCTLKVQFYNLSGKEMRPEKLTYDRNSILQKFDISSLDAGIYLVKISTDNKTVLQKLSVIR